MRFSHQKAWFTDIKAMVSPQPCSMYYPMKVFDTAQGVGDFMNVLDEEQNRLGGFSNPDMTPHLFAPNVKIPTLVSQVHHGSWTIPDDVQTTFDLLGSTEKELLWIEGTPRRFDEYNYFGQHPEKMLAWFSNYMKS